MDLTNSKVLVVGLGRSGRAAARFLLHRGAVVTGVDSSPKALADPKVAALRAEGLQALPEAELADLSFSLVVASPGVPPTNAILQRAARQKIEIVGEVELACRYLTQPVLAITGTNGKTTVTLLVAHVLQACGHPAKAVGNVGVALTGELDRGLNNEILSMELSSYQLETLHSRVIDAAVVLNVTPDHLDRHSTMESYAKAKLDIYRCLKPGGSLYIQDQVAREYGYLLNGVPYRTFGGPGVGHDAENEQAARLLCATVGVTESAFTRAAASFKKPPHRIEFVRKWREVSYYDDSKGTNLDAVIKAVHSLPGPMVLIAGGVDKGAAYTPWIEAFGGKVKAICAIGQAAPKISQEVGNAIPVELYGSLEEAVRRATALAKPGECVLLSPGCSSFDMFRDYAHRGEEFKKQVWSLSDDPRGK